MRAMKPSTRRRQRLSKTIALPDNAPGLFSMGMMTVLAAIRDMADKQGRCTATNPHIAEIAGVGQSITWKAIKRAHSIGLIAIEHTPTGKRVIMNKGIGRVAEGG
jgi:hypothetical protein